MRLVLATADLMVEGRSFEGFPLLLADDGWPLEPAQSFQGVPQERLCWFQRPAVIGPQQWESLKRSAFNHEIGRGQDKPHRPISFRSFSAALKLSP